jgi:MtN3 and saliva related transmembrane protein
MNTIQLVGIIAGLLTGISQVPQLIKIIREKKVEGVSIIMIIILMLGLAGWVVYGCMRKDIPIIVTNCFSFLVNSCVLFFRIKYA